MLLVKTTVAASGITIYIFPFFKETEEMFSRINDAKKDNNVHDSVLYIHVIFVFRLLLFKRIDFLFDKRGMKQSMPTG